MSIPSFSESCGLHYVDNGDYRNSFTKICKKFFPPSKFSENGFYVGNISDITCLQQAPDGSKIPLSRQEKDDIENAVRRRVEVFHSSIVNNRESNKTFSSYFGRISNTDPEDQLKDFSRDNKLHAIPETERIKYENKEIPLDEGRIMFALDSFCKKANAIRWTAAERSVKDIQNQAYCLVDIIHKKAAADLVFDYVASKIIANNIQASILETLPGAIDQFLHTDLVSYYKDEVTGEKTEAVYEKNQLIGLLAIEETGADIRIVQGSHKYRDYKIDTPDQIYNKKTCVSVIHLEQFEFIVFEPTLIHSGSGNDTAEKNTRLHFYINLNKEIDLKVNKNSIQTVEVSNLVYNTEDFKKRAAHASNSRKISKKRTIKSISNC